MIRRIWLPKDDGRAGISLMNLAVGADEKPPWPKRSWLTYGGAPMN
jgi:hypothetical protein